MPTLFSSHLRAIAPLRVVLFGVGIAAVSLFAIACGGDDGDDAASSGAGGLATSTVAASSTPGAAPGTGAATGPTRVGGTLVPVETATPQPGTTPSAGGSSADAVPVVEMADLVPCGAETYYEEETLADGVNAISYRSVPEGTAILFPFESGILSHMDAKDDAVSLSYDVPGVGVVTIKAAGINSLDRNISEPVAGTVIGHFAGTFGDEVTHGDLHDAQAYAIVGAPGDEVVEINGVLWAGRPLDPKVTDCLVLP